MTLPVATLSGTTSSTPDSAAAVGGRGIGGHVLDLAAESGDLHVAAFARFDLHLPTDDLFLRTELTHAEDHRIVAVEGGVAVSTEEPS